MIVTITLLKEQYNTMCVGIAMQIRAGLGDGGHGFIQTS